MMDDLVGEIKKFNAARDWDQYHTPKNLANSVMIEAGELAECFQWLTPEQSYNLDDKDMYRVCDEVADVLIYILNLCDKLKIRPEKAVYRKLFKNKFKYPALYPHEDID
jgi:NTP pyrophosphatase (non-canonical NTP hydrolase)